MSTPYRCGSPKRRALIADSLLVNGIDYLEVGAGQTTLKVTFIHKLPDPPNELTVDNVVIEGGVRIKNPRVKTVTTLNKVLTVVVEGPGDFSRYTLRLVASSADPSPPPDFDPPFSAVEFSFKVDCPSEFDCASDPACPPDRLPEPAIDYLTKDYAGFRRLMLDRLAVTIPSWKERSPADVGVVLVEALAFAADQLSYFQDAVSTEAYLGTARQRVSLRRHARLLDYRVHEGCNARAWVCVEVETQLDTDTLVLSTKDRVRFLTRCAADPRISTAPGPLKDLLASRQPVVFETLQDAVLRQAHNRMFFYTWGDEECCLPKGATKAFLRHDINHQIRLGPGDVIIFEETLGPSTGLAADADPSRRHAVRLTQVRSKEDPTQNPGQLLVDPLTGQAYVEVEWGNADALPFALVISTVIGAQAVTDVSVARGNVVLVDHGQSLDEETLASDLPASSPRYRPVLKVPDLTYRDDFDPEAAMDEPATAAMSQDPRKATAAIRVYAGAEEWSSRPDLLESDRFSPDFVVEAEGPRSALRFGDGVTGKRPPEGMKSVYRIGKGFQGNVGSEAIAHVVTNLPGIQKVRNPLPGVGGVDPESAQQVKLDAPQAFRVQKRAVTPEDYARLAERHPEVERAVATRRWTGSWYTMFVTPDRTEARPIDAAFQGELRAYLERFRLAGRDLRIDVPEFAPLDIAMTICIDAGYFRSAVKEALLEEFGTGELTDGRRGFFHPDNLTFGQPVYLSQVIARAMSVPGVHGVDLDDTPPKLNRFKRWGKLSQGEFLAGQITFGKHEIPRLDNDPNAPENGKIDFFMEGGQ